MEIGSMYYITSELSNCPQTAVECIYFLPQELKASPHITGERKKTGFGGLKDFCFRGLVQ